MKIPQDGNRANVDEHVAVVHGHVWRTVCSVCATGARVARPVRVAWPVSCNSHITGITRRPAFRCTKLTKYTIVVYVCVESEIGHKESVKRETINGKENCIYMMYGKGNCSHVRPYKKVFGLYLFGLSTA